MHRSQPQSAGSSLRRVTVLISLAGIGLLAGGCASRSAEPVATSPTSEALDALPVAPRAFMDTASGVFVVVDLDVNKLRLMDGDQVLWEAPVGTGTGLQLRSTAGDWVFSTPRGVFEVKWKEELPVWYLPDWWFVQRNLPIPASNAPERRLPGQLGVAAVYLSEEIAIHGTDRPELLGQRVSHGCIRLENRFAQRLFHNVQVGTPVVVLGGEHLDELPPAPTTSPGTGAPPPPDPLAGVATSELLSRLEGLLETGDRAGAWVPLASRLITRGLRDDAAALRGLLALASTAATDALNREFSTFLADAYARGTLRVVVSLARIDEDARERASGAIVDGTMALHAGSALEERAPWPTRRLHNGMLGPEGLSGWNALLAAEEAYRREAVVARNGDRDAGN